MDVYRVMCFVTVLIFVFLTHSPADATSREFQKDFDGPGPNHPPSMDVHQDQNIRNTVICNPDDGQCPPSMDDHEDRAIDVITICDPEDDQCQQSMDARQDQNIHDTIICDPSDVDYDITCRPPSSTTLKEVEVMVETNDVEPYTSRCLPKNMPKMGAVKQKEVGVTKVCPDGFCGTCIQCPPSKDAHQDQDIVDVIICNPDDGQCPPSSTALKEVRVTRVCPDGFCGTCIQCDNVLV